VGIQTSTVNTLQLDIFPNPTRTNINIVLSGATASGLKNHTTLKVFNSLGEIMYATQLTTDHLVLDLNGYLPGLYFVQLVSENKVLTKQIIKQQ
jgi:hypothetical protein